MTVLLDVNVLIGLIDGDHIYAEAAHAFFDRRSSEGWATCPLTQNAVLRIIGNPRYPNSPGDPREVSRWLEPLISSPHHTFWPDDISILDRSWIDRNALGPAARLTDTYLLALAVRNGGRFATFDRRLAPDAVAGGREALMLL